MMSSPGSRVSWGLLLAFALGATLPACQSKNRTAPRGGGVRATDGVVSDGSLGSNGGGSGSTSEVSLTNEDLAPVDAYIKKRVWYAGDDVDVTASNEYFWQYISFIAAKGVTDRHDTDDANGLVVTVTYLGAKELISEATAPRILIGTGITVSARRRLVVRFVKTRDVTVPVKLRIAVNGDASMGRANEVLRRKEQQIVVGCALRRTADGRYEYQEQ